MNSSSQNEQSTKYSGSRSSSLISRKQQLPSSMEQVISLLKKELRQCKIERQEERDTHKQETAKLTKQIDSLKHKIIQIKQKEYLKTILSEDADEERLRQASLTNTHKKLKLYVEKLQSDIKLKDQIVEKMKEEKLDINNERQVLLRQKEKHLELSIIEKINLEERIQVLEREIQSKENLLKALKNQGQQTAAKEIELKKMQRKLVKKTNEVQHYEEELKNFKQFETQKLHTRIQTLDKQNSFLKEHISKIEHQFNSTNQCVCSSNQCKKEIDMFKNKFINKSRELSKVKVELSKEMFKEQFLKDVRNKENILTQTKSKGKAQIGTSKDPQNHKNFDYGMVINKRQSTSKQQYKYAQDIDHQSEQLILKRFRQNEEESSLNQKTLPNYSLAKYKSEMFKRKDSRPIEFR